MDAKILIKFVSVIATALLMAACGPGQGHIGDKSTAASRSGTMRAPVGPAWPEDPGEPSQDVPQYTSSLRSEGGDHGTSYTSMPAQISWIDPRLTKYGYIEGAQVIGGSKTFPNVSSGHVGATDLSPQWTPTPYFASIAFSGRTFRFADEVTDQQSLPFRLWIDGKFAGEFPMGAFLGAETRYQTLEWPDERRRILFLELPSNFHPIGFGSPDGDASFAPASKLAFRVYMLGDSWVEGQGFVNSASGNLDNMAALLSSFTGWEVFNGGMGKSAPGIPADDDDPTAGRVSWNSPQRIRAIAESQPNLVLLVGTLNADGFATTTLPGFLKDLYSKIRLAAPNAKIVHVGPQGQDASFAGPSRLANRTVCAQEAAAAGVTFIDPIAEQWITGTGTWGRPVSGGNSSLYYGGSSGFDILHLRDYEYYTRRLLASLEKVLAG